MFKLKFLFFIKTILIIVFFSITSSSFAKDFFVKKIIISGEKRLSESFVLKYLPELKDDIITDQILNNITKKLYMSGYFSDVNINIDQGVLEINIEEFPIINKLFFVGNEILSDDELIAIVNIKPRDLFNKEIINEAIENIRTGYQQIGRYLAKVNIKKTDLSEGRVDLIFEIKEGSSLKVKNINFVGNRIFSDNELKSVITTKEDAWYKFFGSNNFIPGRIEYDKEKLYFFYKERGYINFDIKLARGDLLPDFSGFNVNFVIEEGSRFRIKDIKIKSNLNEKPNENLINELFVKKSDYFDNRALDKSSVFLNNYYSDLGYSFVKVIPSLIQNKDLVDVVFTINEGNKTFINKISIIGNSRTSDSVIRRELLFLEGDSFNKTKLTGSINAIRRLGFFSSVNYRIDRTNQTNSVNIIIRVEETNTGTVSFGLGYSSLNSASLTFGLNEKNFLGQGHQARVEVSTSDKRTTYNIGFTEPYYLFKPIALSANIFNEETENKKGDIKASKFGFGLGLGVKQDPNSHKLNYIFSENSTTQSATSTSSSLSGEEGKNILTSGLTYTLGSDTRDSFYNTKTGYKWSISNTFAGLGGDTNFIKSVARYKIYYPLNYGDYSINLKSGLGFISSLDDKVTSSNRFNLGGRTLRGFSNSGLGPRDTGNSQVVGGNNFYSASLELRSDEYMPDDSGLEWVLFSDMGSLWGTDYESGVQGFDDIEPRVTAGFGLSMITAVGPIQFLWGYPLQSKAYDIEENFQFSIGNSF